MFADDVGGRGRFAPAQVAQERPSSYQGLVKDHAQGIDVAGRPSLLALALLRRHVGRRPDALIGHGEGVGEASYAEIGQDRPPIAGDDDVAGLDVTVVDGLVVGVAQGGGHVLGHGHNFGQG